VSRSRVKRHAVRKMKVGPSEPPCRGRPQTAASCYGRTAAVVNVVVKRRGVGPRHVWMRETSANEPLVTHRNPSDDIKTGEVKLPGMSMAETYLLAVRCPVYRRRDSHSGFRTELENLAGDGKGKGASGQPVRPNVPMHQPGADCSVVAMKRGNARRAKGAGHRRRDR
jgi:hypothetical protein